MTVFPHQPGLSRENENGSMRRSVVTVFPIFPIMVKDWCRKGGGEGPSPGGEVGRMGGGGGGQSYQED